MDSCSHHSKRANRHHRTKVQRGGSQLDAGSRSGNAINLGISWATEVNGDRKARLTVEKTSGAWDDVADADVGPAPDDAAAPATL